MSQSGTRIFLRGYKVMASIGVHPHEHDSKQLIKVDVELDVGEMVAPKQDRIGETLNYEWLAETIDRICEEGHVQLVETLNQRIAQCCLGEPRVQQVRVRIEKPGAIARADAAGAELICGRGAGGAENEA